MGGRSTHAHTHTIQAQEKAKVKERRTIIQAREVEFTGL
jgi:hypothetical protein